VREVELTFGQRLVGSSARYLSLESFQRSLLAQIELVYQDGRVS